MRLKSKYLVFTSITATLNTKTNEVENKMPNMTNLAATITITAVENKILDNSKNLTIPEFNKLTTENFATRLAQANLSRCKF